MKICTTCGMKEEFRECVHCHTSANVIDCGHYDQPAFISSDQSHSGGEYCCADCWEKKEDESNQGG
jgi:recombinational DNA repair protein (RecF pathway)